MADKQVKVFYVPFGYRGFTAELLKTAIAGMNDNDYSKTLYLAPTPKKIKEAQKTFHELIKTTYIPPEMMTIKQFSSRLYSFYGDRTIIPKALIPIIISRFSDKSIGLSSIISNFIDEIKQYRPDKDIDSVQKELRDIFSNLNVPEEGLKRTMDAIEVFKNYRKILDEQKALDENDVLNECPALIEKHDCTYDTLIFDGFYEVTPSEEAMLRRLIENSAKVFLTIPHDNNFTLITDSFNNFIKNNFKITETFLPSGNKADSPVYISYPGIDDEVEGLARYIKNLFISGKYTSLDKITLTFPKLHIYYDIIRRVFRRYGIPFTFTSSKPAGKTRPFSDLIAMLESIEDDYPRLQFSQFLISPHFRKLPAIFREWVPRISLISGIVKGRTLWLNIVKAGQNIETPLSALPPEIEKELKLIFRKLMPLESIKEKGSSKQFSEILNNLIEEMDFSDNDMDIRKLAADVLKELSLIDSLILIPNQGGLRQFIDAFKYILGATETEMEGTGVQVSGFFELRGLEPDCLYLGGLKDGDLPSMPDMDHILPDSVRTKLGLVNMKRYLHLQRFIFQRLVESSKNLHLSYPAMESDKLFLPSPFLPWGTETIEKIPGILSRDEELLRQGSAPLSSHIREINRIKSPVVIKKFSENSKIRVTDIDYYRTCPRKFFIEKILSFEPVEIKEYKIEAMLLGEIVHKIMEKLVQTQFKDYDEMTENAEKLFKDLLDKYPLEDYWKNFIKDSFLSILPEIHEIESKLAHEGYSFTEAEKSVEGEVINGIKLKGKIDRVDRKDDSVELIDYKTGTAQLSRSEILNRGATLQLFLYAALMKSLGFKVDRVGLYSLKDIKITWVPGRNDKRDGRTLEDYITASLKFLEKTISKIREGDFVAAPLSEQTCRNCHERPYCPYIQTS